MLGPYPKARWQLYWSARLPCIQCCWWWYWIWSWVPSLGALVCWLWKEIQVGFHCVSISSGVHICCWALQQCSLNSLPFGTHRCGCASWQWSYLWYLQAFSWHRATHLHQPQQAYLSGILSVMYWDAFVELLTLRMLLYLSIIFFCSFLKFKDSTDLTWLFVL